MFLVELWRCVLPAATNIVFIEPEERPAALTHLIGAVSPLWPPSPRPLGGFCQSSWISPRQPYPRRSPYNPWLQTQARTHKQDSASATEGLGVPADAKNTDEAAIPRTALWRGKNSWFQSLYPRVKSQCSPPARVGARRWSRCTRIIRFIKLRLLTLVHVQTLTALCSHPSTRGGAACAPPHLSCRPGGQRERYPPDDTRKTPQWHRRHSDDLSR